MEISFIDRCCYIFREFRWFIVLWLLWLILVCFFVGVLAPPSEYPTGLTLSLSSGQSLSSLGDELVEIHAIRSKWLFQAFVVLWGGERSLPLGTYLLDKPESIPVLAFRFARGKTHVVLNKITFPEGWTRSDMASALSKELAPFDSLTFLSLSKDDEGYLFPDTYFFAKGVAPSDVVKTMKDNFSVRFEKVPHGGISRSKKDIVIMASILEDEAKTSLDRRIIAGILWRRLDLGVPLQVDSTIAYATGKPLSELSPKDLTIDSPYNTYKYAGLPKGPVGNPGLDALTAAVQPTPSDYMYYISDKNGVMHYAKTFDEHKKNIERYLK